MPLEWGFLFYSQLDGTLLEVNQLLKYIKFGFGQATDHACYDIREGLISREEGIYLVKELDGRCDPLFISQFCKYIDISVEDFWKHANSFRGPMWLQTKQGQWVLDNPIWEQIPYEFEYTVQDIITRLNKAACYGN